MKKYELASAHLNLAHDIFVKKQMKNPDIEALGFIYLAKLNFEMGYVTNVEEFLRKALKLSKERDLHVYKSALCDLGVLKSSCSEHQDSIDMFQEAIKYNIKLHDQVGLMRCYSHMVNALRKLGQDERAKEVMKLITQLDSQLHSQTPSWSANSKEQ